MGRLHSLLFRMLYPVPQKGEDLLSYKQKFVEEYISSGQLGTDFALFFIAKKLRRDASYAQKYHDKEQKQRLEAYKTWKKFICKKERN